MSDEDLRALVELAAEFRAIACEAVDALAEAEREGDELREELIALRLAEVRDDLPAN